MNLFLMCINVIAKPDVIELYKNQLSLIPVKLKTVLLKILCKRGFIKDIYILNQLINSQVTEVDLSECIVNDDMLSCLGICKYLQKLDLSLRRKQSRYITSKVLGSVLKNLQYLKIIAIPRCEEVNDEVINIICENCPQLRELDISYSSITDVGLSCIGQNLCQLCIINLLGTQISDVGIYHLISGPLAKSLAEINIDKCLNTSSYSTAVVAEKCSNIKIFSCGSYGNNDEMISAINSITPKAKQVFWNI